MSFDIQKQIIDRIQATIPNSVVELTDLTGTADHWEALIVSDAFEGKRSFERQRWVYQALGELMHGPIHAFTMKTLTVAQAQGIAATPISQIPQTPQSLVQLK
jgi:stress-induced morphogen